MDQGKLKSIAVAAALTVFPALSFAQETTQTGVVGPSGDAVFSVRVQGANGVLYNCRPDIRTINGVPTRICNRVSGATTTPTSNAAGQGSLGTAGAGGVFAAIGAALLIGALGGGDSTSGSD